MYHHLLVPIDGTDLSTEISSEAVAFARALGARITFFHAQPDYAAALDGEAEIMRLTSPTKFAYAYHWRVRELLAKAEATARALGVACGSTTTVSDSPAQAIIAAASAAACDLIYMASHGRRSKLGMMLGSQTLKVLVNAGMPVLVAVASIPPRASRATDLIRDEYRSLAALLHAWLELIDAAGDGATRVDAELMRAVVHYLKAFPATAHCPTEAECLHRLGRRSSRYDADLAELDKLNAERQRLLGELEAKIESHPAATLSLADLRAAFASYEHMTWEHIKRVEGALLPAALCHLAPQDWEEIDAAIPGGGDPHRRGDTRAEFRRIFSHIVNLVPTPGTP